MDYEKKYKEALEKARPFSEHPLQEDSSNIVEYIFPELRESEGERIRQAIINVFATHKDYEIFFGASVEDILAWLEAQGGQKPLGFNIGDEITVNGQIYKVVAVEQKPTENKGMNLVEEEMTPFQKKVFCIIDTTIEEEQGLKQVCDELLALASNEIKQKPAEWTEEDEKKLLCICAWIKDYPRIADFKDEMYTVANNYIDWLKALKERYTWKPSDEQMKALDDVISSTDVKYDVLSELWKDLKKLMGE